MKFAPLFAKGSPFTVGQRTRMLARLKSDWLAKHRNRLVTAEEIPEYVKPFGGGWALEGRAAGSYLPRFYLVTFTPPQPPKKPRYRVSASLADGWRTVSDSELRAFGENPEDYQPGPAFPPPVMSHIERLACWVASVIVVAATAYFYSVGK